MRVSYLEVYNEEIFDLLSATDDTTRLRLYEDSTKKGSVIIQVIVLSLSNRQNSKDNTYI